MTLTGLEMRALILQIWHLLETDVSFSFHLKERESRLMKKISRALESLTMETLASVKNAAGKSQRRD